MKNIASGFFFMKTILFFVSAVTAAPAAFSQDIDYKKGTIQVDGKDYLKMDVKKQNFGLTKSFEVYSLSGTKIIIAVVATEFQQERNDNSYLYYRLSFLTANQVGIFKVPALGQEKGFAKLLGASGIMVNDVADEQKVKEFIALKSASPVVAIDYTVVSRNTAWPIRLQQDLTIEQDQKTIGSFKYKGNYDGQDSYDFLLPSGITVAKVSFTGGNNLQNMEIFTAKDNIKRVVPLHTNETIKIAPANIDKNQFGLQRIVKWLVDNKYL